MILLGLFFFFTFESINITDSSFTLHQIRAQVQGLIIISGLLVCLTEVSQECHVRRVNCVDSWHCGLISMTVTSGERVELDCLGEVMEAMGKFTWRVSWRHTRGVISSDNSLFAPNELWFSGTYRCDVQDLAFRRVKRIYWGVRVLPTGVLNLDYENSLDQWETTGTHQTSSNLAVNYIVQVYPNLFLNNSFILLPRSLKGRQGVLFLVCLVVWLFTL
uniref:Transmembrane protein 81 n=1 Tax=Sphaeramia orbicularis TaxID=375764 RepID=A0A673AEW3_9TELE